jgi:hypothetical protein
MLALAAGVFAHLILDGMWQVPATLFWPFMGFSFPREVIGNWWQYFWNELFSDPSVYVSEIIGLIILLILVYLLFKRKSVLVFIKRGKIS